MIGLLQKVLNRGWVVYLLLFIGVLLFTNYKSTTQSGLLQGLARLQPSFNYFEKIIEPGHVIRKDADECVYYHRRVAELVPNVAGESLFVAGVCSYKAGDAARAEDLFERSLKVNSYFFWARYDLALLYFKKKEFTKAGDQAAMLITLDPKVTRYLLQNSKIFMDIRRSPQGRAYDLDISLDNANRHIKELLKLCMICVQDPAKPFCEQLPFELQIF